MDRSQELEEQVRQLTRTVNEMRARMARLEGKDRSEGNGHSPSSRRGFLKLGAGAALGAVGLAAAKVLPVAAADGAAVTTGNTVTGEHPTIIQGDAVTAVPVFAAEAPGFSQAALTASGETFAGPLQGLGTQGDGLIDPTLAVPADGVDGWAEGIQAFGVYGLTDAGVGVTGESSTGIGLYARSSGRILQDPRPAGKPTYTPNDFEQVRDAAGAMWISGPGSTWKQVATTDLGFHVFPNPRRIVDGFAHPMTAGVTYGPFDATLESNLTTPTGVPLGAQAAWCAVQSYKPGVLTLYPDGTTDPLIANYSGTGNLGTSLNMLYLLVPLSAVGKFKIHSYITGIVVVDAWGFLM